MSLTIAYSKIKKRNLVLINNDTHQRETVSERPIRPPLILMLFLSSLDNLLQDTYMYIIFHLNHEGV